MRSVDLLLTLGSTGETLWLSPAVFCRCGVCGGRPLWVFSFLFSAYSLSLDNKRVRTTGSHTAILTSKAERAAVRCTLSSGTRSAQVLL